MKKTLSLFVLLATVVQLNAQTNISRIFKPSVKVTSRATDFARDAISLEADLKYINEVYKENNDYISLTVPISEQERVVLNLEKFNVLSSSAILRTSKGDTIKDYKPGIFYRGFIKDKEGFATVSIFENQISSIISIKGIGDFNVVKYENSDKDYIVYNDKKCNTTQSFECHTPDDELYIDCHRVDDKVQTREVCKIPLIG